MVFKEHTLFVLGFLGSLLIYSCGSKPDKILPKRTSITESVYSSITIQPDSIYQVYTIVAGILESNLVEEGDKVSKGDTILQVINTAPAINTDNAKLSYELALENYDKSSGFLKGLKNEIRSALLKYKNDSVNYHRQLRLWEQKIGSKIELDNKQLAFELSKNNLSLLKSEYQRTENELRTKVRQANNNFRTAEIATKDFTVNSKINGKVYALNKNPGELVNTMESLASIGSADVFLIEMLVDEVDIVKVKLGQKVILTLDAYQNQIFEAEVSKIYPKKDSRSQTFKVEALFDKQPEVLYPGLSGEGNIIIAQREEAIVIPKGYLVDGNMVRTEDGLIPVKLGLQNLNKIEITEGINVNTYILKPEE
ncbi:HlyD family efflux transporter periplasmic adaptor subunit [Kriegella sp. EG-1]|nr:HlyD family efflux transporter periplasmic adaptor subunit [Flavobacteriaceae bacterium EG-1]